MSTAFTRVQNTLFFGLLALSTLAFLWLVQDYIIAMVWAVILAVLFYPLHTRLSRVFLGRRALAAATTVLIAVLLVFVPIAVIGGVIASETLNLYNAVSQTNVQGWLTSLESLPLVEWLLTTSHISLSNIQNSLASFLQSAGSGLASGALGAGAQIASFAAKTLVMLYVLFFLLKDGPLIGARIMRSLPLGDEKELFLFERFSSTTQATIKGSLLVALAQGAIGAVLFAIAGISNPILWGALMALFALIPAIGPAIVWVPAGIFAFFTGNVIGAVIVIAGGVVIISTIDNLLRPILVGRDTGIPDALILLSVLGGLGLFGLSGVILGPVIAALFLALWELFEKEYRDELIERG